MKAAVLRAFGAPLSLEEVPTPVPGPDDVLVRVMACGVDGTDLKLLDGFGYKPNLPFIMGHEPAGMVAAVGGNVDGFQIGDRVIPYIFLIPPDSRWYGTPREQLCPEMQGVLGVTGIAGGYAENFTIPARQLVRLPDAIDWADAAVLCDAGLTAYHAVDRSRLQTGETALVIGVGGVGSFVVQFARLAGARVIAVDRSDTKSAHALGLGAEIAINSSRQDVLAEVRRATNGRGVECVLDIVGQAATMQMGIDALAVGGRMVVVGYTPDELTLGGKRLAQGELEIIGSRGGPRGNLFKAAQLVAEGRIKSIVTDTRPLGEVNEALAQLRAGQVLGRLVLQIAE
ncbi:MAG: zinc-binding dehydrogenase [Pirellulales bacterium]